MTVVQALDFALESLRYTEKRFREYQGYPSEDFRRERLADVAEAQQVLRALRKELADGTRA